MRASPKSVFRRTRGVRLAFSLALVLASQPAAAATMTETTWWFCTAQFHAMGAEFGVTAIAAIGPGLDTSKPHKEFKDWLSDASSGDVQINGYDPAIGYLFGNCRGFTDEASARDAQALLFNARPQLRQMPALFDPKGNIPRPGEMPKPIAAAAPAPKAPEPALETTKPAEPPAAPAPRDEHEATMAEHRRLVAAIEKAGAEYTGGDTGKLIAAFNELTKFLARFDEKSTEQEEGGAAIRAEWARRAAGMDAEASKEDERVEFKEGVVLCRHVTPEAKVWSCQGPLQNTSVIFDSPMMSTSLGQACGSDRSIRDLGMVSGYRAFGCGFGIHPTARDYPGNTDVPAKMGLDYVPGRGSYVCPRKKLAYCRG